MTLLVPPQQRHYNQSSGAENKRERDEKSYFLGAYSSSQAENELTVKTEYLRKNPNEIYSVLLAYFYNAGTDQSVTLAQIRWFINAELKRLFLVSANKLTIKEHFLNQIDPDGEWRKRLRQLPKTRLFDSFSEYSSYFANLFGLKSEKALNLFNLTVGIKVLGNLNDFVRKHMLEDTAIEDEFDKLRDNYHNLINAHTALEKAREQLRLLEPIITEGQTLKTLNGDIQRSEHLFHALPAYFATLNLKLYSQAHEACAEQIRQINAALEELHQEFETLDQSKTDLTIAISHNEQYRQIEAFDRQIHDLKQQKALKEDQLQKYNTLAKKLGLPINPDEKTFFDTLQHAKQIKHDIEVNFKELENSKFKYMTLLQQQEKREKELNDELQSLRSRKSQIPLKNLALREMILTALQIPDTEIPFVGELIKVKDEESAWQNALERLLRNFGLCLLVPEQYYAQFNQYVNVTNLKNRLIYYKIIGSAASFSVQKSVKTDTIFTKLHIKPKHKLGGWVAQYIQQHYDYICANDLTDFQRLPKALTKEGLLKNIERHEKDDRPNFVGQDNYILGWDNKEKIQYLTDLFKSAKAKITKIQEEIKKTEATRKSQTEKRDRLNDFLRFDKFQELDWQKEALEIQRAQEERQRLVESSQHLKELEKQLNDVKTRLDKNKSNENETIERRTVIKGNIQAYKTKIEESHTTLASYKGIDAQPYYPEIANLIEQEKQTLTIENTTKIENMLKTRINRCKDDQLNKKHRIEKNLERKMAEFKNPDQELQERYRDWTVETHQLHADTTYLNEYEDFYTRLKTEDLPSHQQRFKEWLNERVIEDMASFKTTLENQLTEIEGKIGDLNDSLQVINFNPHPPTYIQLDKQLSRDAAIRDFRGMLQDVLPDAAKMAQNDEQALEASFHKIKPLIEKLQNDENWRKKVTDVRNWLEFGAREIYSETKEKGRYYADSTGLSGGEKAKLAYTILASAIAYQFGIDQKIASPKSFRFVVVDEAFSKVDPENSKFALELFQQLHLQLLVITPLDKISIVEPYIQAVHYVENKRKRNSEVFDLTMPEYYELKDKFNKAVAQ